ncbi:MAG: hypothetical protein AABY42_07535 [Nitrospirota bacterium]
MFQKVIQMTFMIILLLYLPSVSYPAEPPEEGYDENTEVIISGVVNEFSKGMHGPLVIRLSSGNRTYFIITAPLWYLKMEKTPLRINSNIEVTGSKYYSKEGRLYIIAKKIKDEATGSEIHLRDSSCRPMWHGMRNR